MLNVDTVCKGARRLSRERHPRGTNTRSDPTNGKVPAGHQRRGGRDGCQHRRGTRDVELSVVRPQSFVNGLSDATFRQLLNEGAFNNYAIQGLYTPGSTFKLITATAELQTGVFPAYKYVDDTGTFKVPGVCRRPGCVFHDDDNAGRGPIDLPLGPHGVLGLLLLQPRLPVLGEPDEYGQTPIQNVAHDYGLDQYTNVDLPNETEGRVDSPTVRKILHAESPLDFPNVDWYTGDNIEMAFGQGTTALTPIEMANAYATFANGGTRYEPEVAAAIINAHNKVVVRYQPRVLGHVNLPAERPRPDPPGARGRGREPRGTAYGTFPHSSTSRSRVSDRGQDRHREQRAPRGANSWFVGFGPMAHPQYVVLCVIAEGGYGADAAGPVVARPLTTSSPPPPGPVSRPQLSLPSAKTTSTTSAKAPG